jgi:valyl-tRNA synthetase
MKKTFAHQIHEPKLYKLWESSKAFTPKLTKNKKAFTIIMPPPNANDNLHIGHARFVTIEDILIRYQRMQGKSSLWLPGADHAGIETQFVFEKHLAQKGKSRFDYDQDTLYNLIWDFTLKNKAKMENQLRALGASCDWTRNKFTLDPDIVKIVYQTFKKLYDEGLIYRGEKIVNYCPKCGTNFSELEVNYKEVEGKMYFLNYGPVTIATTRPETIFADVAIAVNPKDEALAKHIGKQATIPLVNRKIPIIADSLVNPDFGTGALKITPGHDPLDFEIGQKHDLPVICVIDENGKMTNTPPQYIGMSTFQAREAVAKDLAREAKLTRIKKIKHLVGFCYRCKGLIEPAISKQWFIKINPLTTLALKAIQEKKVIFTAKKYEKIAKHWLKNLKDWNISRQIVWGIRIPAWRCNKCLKWTITDGKEPIKCSSCQHQSLTQDTDTFDTWFSSGQWPFVTLMTTKKNDFQYFYPTSVMETAYDILPFWVIRMIMLGLYVTNNVPFNKVLIHGLVRDKKGVKISKSKGNVVNPLEMVDKYGADALRMAIVWGALVENDIALSDDNVRGQRNFANKIWNIARFILTQDSCQRSKPRAKTKDDKKILSELKIATKQTTKALDKYRLNQAAEIIYDFIWHKFADSYLEKTKSRKEEAQPILEYVLQESLKLAHPFMPFVTEAIWQTGFNSNKKDLLINASWPQ